MHAEKINVSVGRNICLGLNSTGFPQSGKVRESQGKKAVMEKSWKLKKINKVMETEKS